jgi:hypothetical protein
MPNKKPITIPLVGQPNPRGTDVTADFTALKDQIFVNCLFEKVTNPVTGNTFIGCNKRPGLGTAFTAGNSSFAVASINWIGSTNASYSNMHLYWGPSSVTRLYRGTTSMTLVEELATSASTAFITMTEQTVNLVSTLLFTATDNKGYYTQQDAMTTAVTFTADTTNGSPTLATVSSTTGLLHGQTISGTGVPANTYLKIVGSTVTLMDNTGAAVNATATNSGVTMTRSVIALIVSTAFPGNATLGKTLAGKFTSMNGFLFISDTLGNVWNPDLNSVVNWTSTSSNNASEIPDAGTVCARKGNIICEFGTKSIEFFQNNGNTTGSILSKVGTPVEIGCASYLSLLEYDDTVYWIGRRDNDDFGVYMLEGFTAKLISPAFVNADITQYGNSFPGLARFDYGGHPILAVTVFASGGGGTRTWIYQMDTGIWGNWTTVVGTPDFWRFVTRIASSGTDKLLHLTGGNGNGYVTDMKTPVYTDNDSTLTRTIRTRVLDFGTGTRKILSWLRLIGNKMASACDITITYSDDDYATQSVARTFDMTRADTKLSRWGMFNRRSFTLTDAATVNCRLEYLEIPTGGLEMGSV